MICLLLKNFRLASKKHGTIFTRSTSLNEIFSHYSSKSTKKVEERIKIRLNYYVENELPDKSLEAKLKNLKFEIKTQVHLIN